MSDDVILGDDYYEIQSTPTPTDNDFKTFQHTAISPVSLGDTFLPICASAVPPSASAAGPSRGYYPPGRRGSLSSPNLRQTLAPLTTTTLAPRPRSINLPSPAHSHPAGFLNSPIHLDTPSSHTPSYLSTKNSAAELGADHLAQARAEFIEADARSERRIRRSRAPARSAVSGATRSRSSSRQQHSRPSSQARPLSTPSPYPPSITGTPEQTSSLAHMGSRASIASSVNGGDHRPQTPMQMSPASDSDSLQSGSSAPGIRLEPPSPEQERRSHLRSFSDMLEVSIQSPSTASLPRYSSSSPSPPSSPRDGRTLVNDSPTPMSSTGSSGLRTAHATLTHTLQLPSLPERRTLRETTPLETPRYTRQKFVSDDTTTFTVPVACFAFPHSTDGQDPDLRGWVPLTHSEGALYFYHPEKRAFTEAYLYEEAYLDEVDALVSFLERTLEALPGVHLPDDYELVAQVSHDGEDNNGAVLWEYYYVDHSTRGLFWLFPFTIDDYLVEISGPLSPSHFKHLLESWYWDHVSTFPDTFQTHNSLVDELVGHLTFFSVDVMTSHSTTVPYELNDLTRMIKFLGRKEPGDGAVPSAAALGRMMSIFCHWRYIHFHGQRYARLDRFESIHGPSVRPRSWLMTLSSFLFLSAPEVHLRDIEKLFVDGALVTYIWKRHISKLQDEWTEFVLYATVMLTANVSMLSVPDVLLFPDNSNEPGAGSNVQSYLPPLRSPAAIASYASILCSVGSIVLGLILIRSHRTKNHDEAMDAVNFMFHLRTRAFFHEPIAILYSLPYALLMWAMLSFLASILIFTLKNTDVTTQITVAGVSIGVSGLIAWCIVALYEPSDRTLKVYETVKQMLMLPWTMPNDDTTSGNGDMSEKPGRWLRTHSRSLAKKMREVKVPCVNAV